MCVILSVYKQKDFTEQSKNLLLNKAINQAELNKDGFSLVAFNRNDKRRLMIREMKFNEAILSEALDKFDCVNLHLRQATSGKVDENNLHFWHYKGWYLAHNGMVSNYGVPAKSELSDSYLFFRELAKSGAFIDNKYLNIEMISAVADRDNLWGRLIFAQPKSKKVFYFGDYHSYLIPNEALIISSTPLHFGGEISYLGLEFEKDNIYLEKDLDGVFTISLASNRFYQIKDDFPFNWNAGYYRGGSYLDTENDRDLPPASPVITIYPARKVELENHNEGYKSWQNKREIGFI